MAETLDDIVKRLGKVLSVLDTPETIKAKEEIEQSLKDMKKIGRKKRGGTVSRKSGGTMTKAEKETIRRNRQSILRSHRAKEKSAAGRRRLSKLLGENTGIGLTKKDVEAAKRKRKRTPAMGVTPKDVKQAKKKRTSSAGQRRRAAHQMADVEKGVTKDVRRGKKYSDIAKTISETGGLRGKIARGALALQGGMGDTTYKEAIKRGKAQGAKARKEARTATDRSGKEHMDPYGLIRKSITGGNRKGGTVKRKRGGKIMVGYKAGGKV